jgi:anti-sigma factor RsiW
LSEEDGMGTAQTGHVADRLAAWAAGDLPESEAAGVREHLASCASCAEERDLLEEARSVFTPIQPGEPRPGFAIRVAARAAELHVHPTGAPWWRWAFAGAAAAAAVAAVVLVSRPAAVPGDDLLVAQRLELFEDLSVVQNQDALRDIDVVAQLHTLGPEGKP